MAELGLEGTSPLSPSVSLPPAPAPALERSHSDGEAGVDEAEGKKPRRSIVGRLWKPSFRRTSVTAPTQGVDPMDTDEYNDELVDWLDIIGTLGLFLPQNSQLVLEANDKGRS